MNNTCKTRTKIRNEKIVKIVEPVKRHNANRNSEHIDNTSNYNVIPIWQKAALTIEEAATYSNIGITKLYEITNNPMCNFVLHVGTRKRLIKRQAFGNIYPKA